MNTCDHGHETNEEVRLLPYAINGGNIIVCEKHYRTELKYRRDTDWQSSLGFDAYPQWQNLKVYQPE